MLKQRLVWLMMSVSLVCFLWLGALAKEVPAVSRLDRFVNQLEGPLPSSTYAQTPLTMVVAAHPLSSTYYYHFESDVPENIRPLFAEAVAVFNQTGLVKLIPGTPQQQQNGLTFFTYDRETTPGRQDFTELGEGGPTIRHRGGWQAQTVNLARSGLNLAHPELQIRLSVAIHEIGHALGLAHSESQRSVMYPVDQLQETLSAADLRALRLLYG
ncbi:matrixin family metalloprotease [Levilactobacillus cerevisiae]|uniref:matrixin family metalloprotease n=1 Tax=Levilactobacillus cerevisiae TaxID=1704076 RepID=UPI000F79BE71|nr:matrixin family metalloprotease [Levilactobacillus cerevisiae]